MLVSLVVNRKPERRLETHDWYDIESLRNCATRQCRFCALVNAELKNYSADDEGAQQLNQLAKTKISLGVRLMDPKDDGCEIYVMADLRESHEVTTETRVYNYILAEVSFRIVKGKMSPPVVK